LGGGGGCETGESGAAPAFGTVLGTRELVAGGGAGGRAEGGRVGGIAVGLVGEGAGVGVEVAA